MKHLLFLAMIIFAVEAPAQDQSPSVAILVTHASDTNFVTDLLAQYRALRMDKYGYYPTTLNKYFHLMIEGTQGGATWTNQIEIPFESIRRITFAPSLGNKTELDVLKTRGPELIVEKSNGSSISIKRINFDIKECYIYEEVDPAGKLIKSFRFDILLYYKYGQERLDRFIGSIITPLGQKGSFNIQREDVRSIDF